MSISFESKLLRIKSMNIFKVTAILSEELPSRGMVMAKVTIKNNQFEVAIEPDGKRSHWFEITTNMAMKTNIKVGEIISLTMQVIKEWKDPKLPIDIIDAIKESMLEDQ